MYSAFHQLCKCLTMSLSPLGCQTRTTGQPHTLLCVETLLLQASQQQGVRGEWTIEITRKSTLIPDLWGQ